ncbi:MAG: 2-oxoacid:acceptor oxidoreductase subunit alpha [Planctomycetes bacterium]|nr:2-oxoacid:acceptor oxidoreductase subunit alpha [Planctomycetota bacterium]
MKADPKNVYTGAHYIDGDVACAFGAIAAGCKFLGGYPITPSTEAAEAYAVKAPYIGGQFIQMEDELGSIASVVGASWAGKKAMTITSGPGFSLMMETVGLGAAMEAPFVIINIQRAGPSTGVPTSTGQGDMMQSLWGSQGDYDIIAVAPESPQECFELTFKAFNLAEKYRVPVMIMADECVGHMTEKVDIPEAGELEVLPRRYFEGPKEDYLPFKRDKKLVPWMSRAGAGHKLYITGLTHGEDGRPVFDVKTMEMKVKSLKESTNRFLVDKIRKNRDDIIELEEHNIEGADVVVVSYGISARVAVKAVEEARQSGIKVGTLRLITVWPFPEKRISELAKKVKGFVVPEINYGQVVYEVDRCSGGQANVILVPHGGAAVHDSDDILKAIKQAARDKERYNRLEVFQTKLEREVFGEGMVAKAGK